MWRHRRLPVLGSVAGTAGSSASAWAGYTTTERPPLAEKDFCGDGATTVHLPVLPWGWQVRQAVPRIGGGAWSGRGCRRWSRTSRCWPRSCGGCLGTWARCQRALTCGRPTGKQAGRRVRHRSSYSETRDMSQPPGAEHAVPCNCWECLCLAQRGFVVSSFSQMQL
jgi:hypothetical protein